MKVAFRVDASHDIGTGHVMRCLALAEQLQGSGGICRFVCRDFSGNMAEFVRERGFQCDLLPAACFATEAQVGHEYAHWLGGTQLEDAEQTRQVLCDGAVDWLIVDHYALDAAWERQIRGSVSVHLLAIDDLANRPHLCDVLLDQNPGRRQADYEGLLPSACRTLIGPRYALLRPEFAVYRADSLKRRARSGVQRVLVTMGGVDKDNHTQVLLRALEALSLPETCKIVVVMGPLAPGLASVREFAATMTASVDVRVGVSDMASVMYESDMAIGAGGVTALERCCLGVPTLTLVIAENQRSGVEALAALGAVLLLDEKCSVEVALKQAFNRFQAPGFLEKMQVTSATLVDGKGIDRVVEEMLRV